MGLKMPKAYSEKLKRDIKVDEAVKKNIREGLFCSNEKCRIPLTLVDTFKRNSRLVSAHFRRREKKEHIEECDYNTLGQINIVARESEGALASINDKKYRLRLNLISTDIKNNRLSKQKETTALNINSVKQPTKNYSSIEGGSAYLSTIKKIMQIKSKIEDHYELRNLIEIQFNDKNIRWSDFYFENDKYENCFKKICTNKIDYPICIEGEIKSFERPNETFSFYSIKLKLQLLGKDKNDTNRYVAVSILLSNDLLFENLNKEFESGKRYVAFCTSMRAKSVKSLKSEFLNLTGVIYNKKQIHIY